MRFWIPALAHSLSPLPYQSPQIPLGQHRHIQLPRPGQFGAGGVARDHVVRTAADAAADASAMIDYELLHFGS
jgi:hypothetical protein